MSDINQPTISVTIAAQGAPDAVIENLRRLFAGLFALSDAPILPTATVVASANWTLEEFAQLWSQLKNGAREVLMHIAENNGRISSADIQEELKVDNGFQVAGRMSSLGFALKRLGFASKEPIYTYDYTLNVYSMKPHIVDMVLQAVPSTDWAE